MNKEYGTISIFEYEDYRAYLRDLYEHLKKTQSCFSYRFFSARAGFRSPNILKLVIEGKRNLSPRSVEKFARALKLKKDEAEFFRALVNLNQARTVEEKGHHAEQLMRLGPFRRMHPIRKDQFEYYALWYNIPIREMLVLPTFSEDARWIAKALVPPVSPQQARRAIDLLLGLGLVKRDEEGRLVQAEAHITTGDEVTSTSVKGYHREMIQKASEAMDRFSAPERDISSVTLALSEEGFKQVKALIQQFRKELLAIAGRGERSPEAVYQINFQLFPLTRVFKAGKGDD